MSDYAEEQRSEVEALEAIYPDEFTVVENEPYHRFTLSIKTQDYEEGTDEGAFCLLSFTYVERYPDEAPLIDVEEAVNVDDSAIEELTEYLLNLAQENLGMVMVFTLVSGGQEWLTNKIEEVKEQKQMEEDKKAHEKEEAERKKFEGTRVTVESFLSWKAAFDAEILALKKMQKSDSANKKLTGRELFEKDQSMNESDIKFLQDGEEDIKVDESLFQELDELGLDEDLLDDEDDS